MTTEVQPGDVLVVTGSNWAAKLIEIGAILRGRDAASHVAVYWGTGKTGIPLCIEGRPGGVGWRDARTYLNDRRTLTSTAQPKTPEQRQIVCATMVKLLGTEYAWVSGITADVAEALHMDKVAVDLDKLWAPDPVTGKLPGEVVCSSAATWAYAAAKLATPRPAATWERTSPGDWGTFIQQRGWEHP